MTRTCPTCGQPLPAEARRDPPLPPLDHPAVVAIHDLPAEERAKVKIEAGGEGTVRTRGGRWVASSYRLRTPRDVVDGREGGDA